MFLLLDTHLKPEHKHTVYHCQFLPIQPQIRSKLDRIIDIFVEKGICRPVHGHESPQVISNMLCVKKESSIFGIRAILDSRYVNYITQKHSSTMLTKQELFESFANKQIVSSLDVSNAYYSLPVNQEDELYLTFRNSKRKKFAMCRAPQGFSCSSAGLENLMTQVLDGLDNIICFADDLYVLTEEMHFEKHMQQLYELFYALRRAKLKVKAKKLFINTRNLSVLGLVFDLGKFSIPKLKLQGFNDFPQPKSVRIMKGFLASVNFVRSFLPDLANKSVSLYNATAQEKKRWQMTDKMLDDFVGIKHDILNHTPITPCDVNKPIFIQTDASDVGISMITYQTNEKDERLFCNAFSKLR